MKIAIAALVLLPSIAMANDHSWHLLTKSVSGTVSLIKDLSQDECEKMRRSLLRLDQLEAMAELASKNVCPAEDDKEGWARVQPYGGCHTKDGRSIGWGGITLSGGDTETAECFQ